MLPGLGGVFSPASPMRAAPELEGGRAHRAGLLRQRLAAAVPAGSVQVPSDGVRLVHG